MAERILRSPGVTTRELDLSAPGRIRPQGIPAGVIGTAQKGPAFVPVTFATVNDFANLFGATEGKHFGAMAVNEWMRNAKSGLFIRTLGVGDGKKADSSNVTTNAGFQVGSKMRNKDSGSSETDGSADGLAINPYAGAGTADMLTLGASTGTVGVSAAISISTITATWSSLTQLDGEHFILSVPNQSTGVAVNHLFFLSGVGTNQATNRVGVGDRSITGTTIVDTDGDITDLTSICASVTPNVLAANIHFVDLTDKDANNGGVVANNNDLGTALRSWIGAAIVGATNSWDERDDRVTIAAADLQVTGGTNEAIVTYGTTGYTKTTADVAKQADGSTSSALALVVSPVGVTAVTAVAFSQTISLGANVPVDGSFISITPQAAGTVFKVGFHSAGTDFINSGNRAIVNTGNDTTTDLVAGGILEALTALTNQNGAGNTGNTTMNATGLTNLQILYTTATNILTISQISGASAVLPSLAKTETNAAAPLGRTYFLGCEMTTPDTTQDYLGVNAGAFEKVLRGVLMFPSGVLPGLETDDSSANDAIASGDMPAAAYGTYAVGKDQGAEIGNHSPTGVFKFVLNGFNNTANYNAHLTGSFDPLSPIYFPKVLNTDPTKIQEKGHYLHAHYDVPVGLAKLRTTATTTSAFMIPGAHNHNTGAYSAAAGTYKPTFENWKQKFSHAFTPWILSQELGSAPKKLFKFHMLDAGIGGHGQVKISIANISKSTDVKSAYGSFDVQIRSANDSDLQPIILQTFSGLNLNPSSDRYIARVIGDQNTFFEFEKNEGKQKLVTEGLYPNKSQYVRVEVVDQVEAGQMEATALPIGAAGKNHLVINGGALSAGVDLIEPPVPFRQSVSIGKVSTKTVDPRFYWGTQYQDVQDKDERNRNTGMLSLVNNLTKHFPSVGEYPAWVGDNRDAVQGSGSADLDADLYNNNHFSLEKVLVRTKLNSDGTTVNTANAVDPKFWHEAIYIRDGNAAFANADGSTVYNSVINGPADTLLKNAANGYRYLNVAKDFASAASKRFYKFTVPMQGGFDGSDIFDKDKSEMANLAAFREMSSNTSAVLGGPNGPTTAAFRKAVDILAEKSDVDIQLLVIPGMREAGITDYAIDKTEERFDALYIMDMQAYDHDSNLVTKATQETSVTYTSGALADRNLDSSFVATYFPDVVLQDGAINVVAPSSVAVLGAMSLNDSVAHPWYAPAGFARGSLPTAIEPAVYLNRPNMDVLYDTDINPITTFPNSGDSVVIFGQKTMLQAQSALDRVNVRRLLIDVRRKVRNVANTILFEPNRESTLARFSSLVNPILGRIQQQQGLDRYKVVIDTTTTTQQDVENNTIRGKIFLQPTRSIEFISLDFVVTNAGAEI